MSFYQNGILISGVNTLPELTRAQYEALPADKRPEYWVCLDEEYEPSTADEITFDNTGTDLVSEEVESAIKEVNAKLVVKADKTDIATVESGTTASRAYSVGELVYVSGTLYRVKTAIASGATFTVGTNVEVTNVSSAVITEINSVNAYMPIFGTTKGRGTIANALEVDLNNVDGPANKVGYVYSGYSTKIPQNMVVGTREVYYYNPTGVFIKLTGADTSNTYSEWGNYFNGTDWSGWKKICGSDIVLRTVDKVSSLTNTFAITGGNIKEFSNLNFQILAGSGHAVASILIPTDLFVAGRVFRAIYTDGVNLSYADVSRASDTVMSVAVNQIFINAQFGVALIGIA